MPTDHSLSESYLRWNEAIAAEFFGPDHRDRPVFIDVEDSVVSRIAGSVGEASDPDKELNESIRENLYFEVGGTPVFARFDGALRRWRGQDSDEPPPHLALLAFFSRVAQGMRSDETYSSSNYYARYRQALGLEDGSREFLFLLIC